MEKDVIRSTHSCPCCVEEKLSKDLAGLIQQGEEDDHESPIDRVLVECGWASPRTLRNRLQEAKEQGIEDAQKFVVDSMVSVIDASKIREFWESTEILADRPEIDGFAESNLNGPPVAGAENYAKRRVCELLAEQIECADVLVLTKMELVPPEQRDFIRALFRLLLPPNPGSLVVPVESGADPSPHLAERVWIDSDWERTVATNTNEDDYKDCVARAREAPQTREELLWWPPTALAKKGTKKGLAIEACSEGMQVLVLKDESACRSAVKACDGLEEGSWEFDMMDQRLGATGRISEVEHEDAIVEVNFGRWDERVGISTFVYVQRRPFHPTRLEAVVKQLPTAIGCPPPPGEEDARLKGSPLNRIVRSKGFVWLATFHTAALYWDHSGGHFSLINIGQWWAATDGGMEGHSDEFEGEFGDRRQELVFIGAELDEAAIVEQLDACLLDDKELSYYRDHFMSVAAGPGNASPGPLPGMPSAVPARHPDDRDPQKRGVAGQPTTEKPHADKPHAEEAKEVEKATAASRHDDGNNAFRQQDYKKAVKLYSQAISLCDGPAAGGSKRSRRVEGRGTDAAAAQDAERKLTLLTNRAECYLRLANYQKALDDCEAALSSCAKDWPKREKTEGRKKLALDKLGDARRAEQELTEKRRAEAERKKKIEEKEKKEEAARAAREEAEAAQMAAELARDQEEEERERQRRERTQQRDTTQEKLNEARELMASAEQKMKDASRMQRDAANTTATAGRRQTELSKKEKRHKEKEARVAEDEKKLRQKHKQLDAREKQLDAKDAKVTRDRNDFQAETDRRRQELTQREERVRLREQNAERQRVAMAKHEKELQQKAAQHKEMDRALKERKRRLDKMQEALDKRERELQERQNPDAAQQVEQQVHNSPAPNRRGGGLGGLGGESGWPASPPIGTNSPPEAERVSRFFPAASDDAPTQPQQGQQPQQTQPGGPPPKSYCCPITRGLMREPVVACDGYTYEQRAIEDWLSQKHVSPMTGERMNDHTLVPNRQLQEQIQEYARERQQGETAGQVSPNTSPTQSGFGGLGLTPGPVRPMALGTSLFGQVGDGGSTSIGNGFGASMGADPAPAPAPAPAGFGQDSLLGIDMLRWQNDIDLGPNTEDHDSGWSTSSAAALQALDADDAPDTQEAPRRERDTDERARLAGEEHDPLAIYVSNINWETTACVCAPRSSLPCGGCA